MIGLAAVIGASMALGLGAEHRFEAAAERLAQRLMSFLLWVATPIIAFFNLAALELSVPVGAGIGFALAAHAVTVAVAFVLGTWVFRLARPSVGALMLAAAFANSGFLGLPFVIALLGFDDLPTAVAYDVLVSLVTLVTVGFSIGAAFGTLAERPRERVLSFFARNPALYATAAGLLAPATLAPGWAVDLSRVMVLASVPLGFFAVGVILAAEAGLGRLGFPPPLSPPVAAAVALKLLLPPSIMLGLSAAVIAVPPAYLSQSAMAAGIQTLVVASAYGLDRALTAAAIAWSTVLVVAVGVAATLI